MMTSTVTTQSTSVHKPTAIQGDSGPAAAGGTLPESSSLSTELYHSAITPAGTSSTPSSASLSSGSNPSTSGQQQQRTILPAPPHSPPPPPSASETKTNMSGLLTKNLDEKLVVATLATLNSGTASSLIKQDLKWIIQSRRKAEGKAELQVEFKKPVKEEQLTSEEVIKRSRRRELNRLAARRSREKGQKRKDMLVEEIRKLQSHNTELMDVLNSLTEQRNQIIDTLRQHMKQCSDYEATQKASVGLSHRVLGMLGVHNLETESQPLQSPRQDLSAPPVSVATPQSIPAVADVSGMSALYISTSELGSSPSQHIMSPGLFKIKSEIGSCPPSPQVLNLGKGLESLPTFLEANTESASPLVQSVSLDSNVGLSDEKLRDLDQKLPVDPKIQLMLHSPKLSEDVEAQIFFVSSSGISSPLQLASPAVLSGPMRTTTVSSSIDLSHFHSPLVRTASDSTTRISSLSPLIAPAAAKFQGPVSKEGSNLMPILPKPGHIQGRRSSTTSLTGSSDEGIAMVLPHSALIGSSFSASQSAPSDSGLGSSQEEGGEGRGEEVIQYKHKLMKHRKQHSTDFTHPSRRIVLGGEGGGAGGRPSLLERSFSFPSSRCEQLRSSSGTFESQSPPVFTASAFSGSSHVPSNTMGFPAHTDISEASRGETPMSLPTCVSSFVTTTASTSNTLPSPLASSLSSSENRSALNTGSKTFKSSNKTSSILKFDGTLATESATPPRMHYLTDTAMIEEGSIDEVGHQREVRGWASPMDTWPPAGSPRSSHRLPSRFSVPERRWSVDDYPAVPLNLSRRSSQDDSCGVGENSNRATASRSSSPVSLPGSQSKTLSFSTDPYS